MEKRINLENVISKIKDNKINPLKRKFKSSKVQNKSKRLKINRARGIVEKIQEENDKATIQEIIASEDKELPKCVTSLKERIKRYEILASDNTKGDYWMFLYENKSKIIKCINEEINKYGGIKYFLCLIMQFKRSINEEILYLTVYRRTICKAAIASTDLDRELDDDFVFLAKKIIDFCQLSSNWVFSECEEIHVSTVSAIKEIEGSSYMPLPPFLINKKALTNIKNYDKKCFLWCVIAQTHGSKVIKNRHRVSHYLKYEKMYRWDVYPMAVKDINKFEKRNRVSVNVFGFDENKKFIYPIYASDEKWDTVVDLLHINNDQSSHYVLINNFNRLMYSTYKKREHRKYYCKRCLHAFGHISTLDEHKLWCGKHKSQRIVFPLGENKIMKFRNFQNQLRYPFIIIADFESLLLPVYGPLPDPSKSNTSILQEHIPCAYSYVMITPYKTYPPKLYRGKNAVSHFIESLIAEEEKVSMMCKNHYPINMNSDEKNRIMKSNRCHICKEYLRGDAVIDHDHLLKINNVRGMAHNKCNLLFKIEPKLRIFLHNLKGYDGHLILLELAKYERKLSCIPLNYEKYMSFTSGNMIFLDSYQFMPDSLSKLVSNLLHYGKDKFKLLNKYMPQKHIDLLFRKQVFCYNYFDSFDKFEEKSLPPIEEFKNDLTGENISQSEYDHAQNIYRTFKMKNLGDFTDFYVVMDTLLLADVFENFRNISMRDFGLDPSRYYSLPGYSMDCSLKMTGVKLDLMDDIDQYLFIEQGMRGGVTVSNCKYKKANNYKLKNYNPHKEDSWLLYVDCNSQYGKTMHSFPMPTGKFKFMTPHEITKFDINELSIDSKEGYILCVDLIYPKHLHKDHQSYPLAPENMTITEDMISTYSKELLRELGINFTESKKLILNVLDKKNYVCHYINLMMYVKLGLKIAKIHKILKFQQSKWIEKYISYNSKKRTEAKSDFEKSFYKYMVNSFFGKTMENMRKRTSISFANSIQKLESICHRGDVKSWRIFNKDFCAFELVKKTLKLDRPVYVGFSILDISKTLMYDFFYNVLKPKFGDNVSVLYTDTDSFILHFKTKDLYKDIKNMKEHFDFSNLAESHILHDQKNAKVLGKFKDECSGNQIIEFVSLKAKMYSVLTEKDNIKRAKGVSKSVVKNNLTHDEYKQCLFNHTIVMKTMKNIRSKSHKINTISTNKVSLSPYDDKRWLEENGIDSKPYGMV